MQCLAVTYRCSRTDCSTYRKWCRRKASLYGSLPHRLLAYHSFPFERNETLTTTVSPHRDQESHARTPAPCKPLRIDHDVWVMTLYNLALILLMWSTSGPLWGCHLRPEWQCVPARVHGSPSAGDFFPSSDWVGRVTSILLRIIYLRGRWWMFWPASLNPTLLLLKIVVKW